MPPLNSLNSLNSFNYQITKLRRSSNRIAQQFNRRIRSHLFRNNLLGSSSYFSELPVEILLLIIHFFPFPSLTCIRNLFKAFPTVFPFLECFKNIHDAGIADHYPNISLVESSPKMTYELLDSLIQSEPNIIQINCPKYLSSALFAQFHERTKVRLYFQFSKVNLKEIVQAIQSKNNKIYMVHLAFYYIKMKDFILLAKALEHSHNRVNRLVVQYNAISFKGVAALSNALLHPHCKLDHLELRRNGIWSDGKELLDSTVAKVRITRDFTFNFYEY
jgi:hypothetical protein